MIRNLVVIGLGLIGGSLALAARQRSICSGKVYGIARRQEVCERAVELGVVDEACLDLAEIAPELGEGDVVFIAVPTLSIAKILPGLVAKLPSTVTVTDGASVKGSVYGDVCKAYGEMPEQFVLGHPIAGSEKSGVEASTPNLYDNHRVILTPVEENTPGHVARVAALWGAVGAEVLELSIADHDEILGATSHLPHAIAFSLVDTLANDSQNENIFRYAAGGFRDFTRIASSDATMWRDIMLANQASVLHAIDLFSENLNTLKGYIAEGDGEAMLELFTRAKVERDHFTQMLENIKLEKQKLIIGDQDEGSIEH